MPSFKEGDALPVLQIDVALPLQQLPGSYLSHTVYKADTHEVVATWPLRDEGADAESGQRVFQQVDREARTIVNQRRIVGLEVRLACPDACREMDGPFWSRDRSLMRS